MSGDRYLKIILTVIAIELGWMAMKDAAVHVSAQPAATPVVIRGVELPNNETLPVTLVRSLSTVRVTADQLIRIRADQPIIVETRERPLLIQSVPAGTAPRPGPGEKNSKLKTQDSKLKLTPFLQFF